jgi:hypothetical protein
MLVKHSRAIETPTPIAYPNICLINFRLEWFKFFLEDQKLIVS